MAHFDKHASFYSKDGKQVVLTKDEMIPILSYIMLQSRVPDLTSQLELITAFASEYMQESSDGCAMSKTYLQLIGTLTYLSEMDLDTEEKDHRMSLRIEKDSFVINEKNMFSARETGVFDNDEQHKDGLHSSVQITNQPSLAFDTGFDGHETMPGDRKNLDIEIQNTEKTVSESKFDSDDFDIFEVDGYLIPQN